MDEARIGLHTDLRKVWITKSVRSEVKRQARYTWDSLYGGLEALERSAVFAHLPTVILECNGLCFREIIKMDTAAQHVVMPDQAGFDLWPGGERVPEEFRFALSPLEAKAPQRDAYGLLCAPSA